MMASNHPVLVNRSNSFIGLTGKFNKNEVKSCMTKKQKKINFSSFSLALQKCY